MADKPQSDVNQPKKGASRDDPIVTTAIGKQLKRLYDEVAEEPVPDRFANLLEELARQESKSNK